MDKASPNRRTFIKVGSTTVAALLVGCPEGVRIKSQPTGQVNNKAPDEGAQSPRMTGNAPGTGEPANPNTRSALCQSTSRDITGPYWRKGIPVRNQFDLYGHKGQKLALTGTVRTKNCEPIPNAVVEMWHANPIDVPAHALSRTDSVDYDMSSSNFRYYGQFATDEQGAYAMTTMKPGWYLNGREFRPSHIHVTIYVDGTERLTTQLYFHGDPFIARDPWASAAPERVIKLSSTEKGHLAGRFDFTI